MYAKSSLTKEEIEFLQSRDKPFSFTAGQLMASFDNGTIPVSKLLEELNLTAYRWKASNLGSELMIQINDELLRIAKEFNLDDQQTDILVERVDMAFSNWKQFGHKKEERHPWGYSETEIKDFTPLEQEAFAMINKYEPRGEAKVVDRYWPTYDQCTVLEMICNFKEDQIAGLQKKVNDNAGTAMNAVAKLDEAKDEIERLKEENEAKRAEIVELRIDLNNQVEQTKDWEDTANSRTQVLNDMDEHNQRLIKRERELGNEIETLQKQIESLHGIGKDRTTVMKEMNNSNYQLQVRITEQKEQIQNLEKIACEVPELKRDLKYQLQKKHEFESRANALEKINKTFLSVIMKLMDEKEPKPGVDLAAMEKRFDQWLDKEPLPFHPGGKVEPGGPTQVVNRADKGLAGITIESLEKGFADYFKGWEKQHPFPETIKQTPVSKSEAMLERLKPLMSETPSRWKEKAEARKEAREVNFEVSDVTNGQTVFIPVEVKAGGDLPKQGQVVTVRYNNGAQVREISAEYIVVNEKPTFYTDVFVYAEQVFPTHWLKPMKIPYVMTPEEMRNAEEEMNHWRDWEWFTEGQWLPIDNIIEFRKHHPEGITRVKPKDS